MVHNRATVTCICWSTEANHEGPSIWLVPWQRINIKASPEPGAQINTCRAAQASHGVCFVRLACSNPAGKPSQFLTFQSDRHTTMGRAQSVMLGDINADYRHDVSHASALTHRSEALQDDLITL